MQWTCELREEQGEFPQIFLFTFFLSKKKKERNWEKQVSFFFFVSINSNMHKYNLF